MGCASRRPFPKISGMLSKCPGSQIRHWQPSWEGRAPRGPLMLKWVSRSSALRMMLFLSAVPVMAADQSSVPTVAAAHADATKPNIIFILADDLGYGDLGCYGQTKIKTPNLDKLAAEGMRFTDFYAGSTVCAPSRCALMTGLDTGHARIRGNANVPLASGDLTVAELLQGSGYHTGL